MKGAIMNSNTFLRGLLAIFMAIALNIPSPAVYAGIVSTNQIAAHSQAHADRAKVQAFLERADVKSRLQVFGVNSQLANDRVAALDDQEVHALAQRIDSLPAGGNLSNLTNSDLTVLLLVAILLVIIV
jgi:Family of unknown function (DUF6627)